MADAAALHDSLQSIAEQGFYDALDYEGTGTDLRSEFTLPDDRAVYDLFDLTDDEREVVEDYLDVF